MSVQERVKWNRLRTSLSLSELVDYFSQNTYSDDKGYGYSAFELDGNIIRAIHTERNIIENIIVDPLGNEHVQIITEYISVKFSLIPLSTKLYLLCIYNPPKSIKNFIDKLCSELNYKVGLGSINIDLNKFYSVLKRMDEISLLKIRKIKVSSMVINDNAKSSIEVLSRKNAINDLYELTGERKFTIDKMKINCLIDGRPSDFEISKAGSLLALDDQIPFYTDLVIQQLLESEG